MIKIRRGFVPSSSLVFDIIKGMRTNERIYRNGGRLFARDVAQCPRKAISYHLVHHDTEVETSAAGKLYMKIGVAVHDVITDGLFANDMLLWKEYRIPELNLKLGGYIDAIILHKGKVRGLEIKTCGAVPSEIKDEHRRQALLYESVTGIKMIVLYVSRSVAKWDGKLLMSSIDLNSTPEQRQQMLKNIFIAYHYSQAELLPPIPPHLTSRADCALCPFVDMCWGTSPLLALPPSAADRDDFDRLSEAQATQLFNETSQRTNGILKFLSQNGTPTAKRILPDADWSELL